MKHRHINTKTWTREAIDSTLQRGNLQDWRDLFQSAKSDITIAVNLLDIANSHKEDGTFALVEGVLQKIQKKSDKL
jgi:C4-type Zn-finger protein